MANESKTTQLCLAGIQAEFGRRLDEARGLFREAWELAQDDYDKAMAAHYLAHLEQDLIQVHAWNLIALKHAELAPRAKTFFGSLYVNLGNSFEKLGNLTEAEHYYTLAAEQGVTHTPSFQISQTKTES